MNRRFALSLTVAVLLSAVAVFVAVDLFTGGPARAADATYAAKVYAKQGGEEFVVASGGTLTVESGGAATVASGGTLTVAGAMRTSAGVGAVVAGKATAVEAGEGTIHQSVLTLILTGANDLDLADGGHGTGVKVYDFPAGRILVLGVTADLSVAHNGAFNASTADTFSVGAGQVIGADDDALSSTEVNLLPSKTLDTDSGATTPLAWKDALVASAQFDGTSAALDFYINVACAAANNSGATTYAITGTVTVTWINLGDY